MRVSARSKTTLSRASAIGCECFFVHGNHYKRVRFKNEIESLYEKMYNIFIYVMMR